MADVKKIRVDIDGNAKGLKQATTSAQGSLNKLNSSVSKLGGALAGAFAVGALTNFAKKSIELYDKQAKAEAKLLTALKGRVDVQQRLLQQASELQKTTLFGDEATIEAQAFLATMGLSEDAIVRLTPLVQDLATKMGSSLTSAADLVAKSVGSSTNALSRYGITIEGAAGSSERLESAIEALTTQVKGQSQAAAEAGAGGITQLSNAFGDLQETIGGLVMGEGSEFIKWLNSVVVKADTFIKSWDERRIEKLQNSMRKFQERINELETKPPTVWVTDEIAELEEKLSTYNQMIIDIVGNQKTAFEDNKPAVENLRTQAEAVEENVESFTKLAEVAVVAQENVVGFIDAQAEASSNLKKMRMVYKKNADSLEDIGQNAVDAAGNVAALALANRASAKDIIQASLAVAIAEIIKGSIINAGGNPILAGILAAGGIALVKGLFQNIPEFARGTSFAPAGTALVGERGPELVNLPRGSSVTPNHQLGGGGSQTLVLNVDGYQLARINDIVSQNHGTNVRRTTF